MDVVKPVYRTVTRDIEVTVTPAVPVRAFVAGERPISSGPIRSRSPTTARETVQLKTRHWHITDAHGRLQEVRGAGVVGEEPVLKPGENFEYTSGVPLPTPSGFMAGTYGMVTDDRRGVSTSRSRPSRSTAAAEAHDQLAAQAATPAASGGMTSDASEQPSGHGAGSPPPPARTRRSSCRTRRSPRSCRSRPCGRGRPARSSAASVSTLVARAGALRRDSSRCGTRARRARGTAGRPAARSDSAGSISSISSTVADQRAAFDPGVVLRHHMRRRAFRRIAGIEIGLRTRSGALGRNCSSMPPARQRWRAPPPPAQSPRRPRAARASGSARSAGNIRARHLRGRRPRARPGPDSGSCRRPDRWSWRDGRGRASAAGSALPAAIAAATRSRSKRAQARTLPGVV